MTESVESLNARVSLSESRGTLSDLLAQQKRLAFSTVVNYLDQLAEAIDLAHEQGFIHRNLNPSTILFTDEGYLVILGLRSAGGHKNPRSSRREARWASYGDTRLMTLAYMAPEQMLVGNILSPETRRVSNIAGMDRSVDGRADLYSLGVVLYQMVTGVLPFQAETPEQMALMHLRMPPPSPRQLRPDLPIAAEQAMLRALAKRPADRYVRAQDLATAFGVALIAAGIQLDDHSDEEMQPETPDYPSPRLDSNLSLHHPFVSRVAAMQAEDEFIDPALAAEVVPAADNDLDVSQPTNPMPVVNAVLSSSTDTAMPPDQQSAAESISINPISPSPTTSTTGTLALSNFQQGNTGTLKLTGPAKVVQVPVAGQPGHYVTGLLPVFPQQPSPSGTLTSTSSAQGDRNKARIILTLAAVFILVVFGSGLFWFIHTHSSQTNKQSLSTVAPNLKATATAQAIATINANIILTDPLSQNIHNWPIATTGSMIYVFENGAYHITDNNPTQGAPAILPDEILHGSFAYTLTMEEIKGDDASVNNEFGLIIRANSQNKNGKTITTFYSFEVLNTKGGEYQFWKYDNSKGSSVTPWTKLWYHSFGKEFHQGHGPGSINTFKIFVNGKSFTLIVNGKQIATVQDNSCTASLCSSGAVGMLVNLKGTEVAFSNLRLTYS